MFTLEKLEQCILPCIQVVIDNFEMLGEIGGVVELEAPSHLYEYFGDYALVIDTSCGLCDWLDDLIGYDVMHNLYDEWDGVYPSYIFGGNYPIGGRLEYCTPNKYTNPKRKEFLEYAVEALRDYVDE